MNHMSPLLCPICEMRPATHVCQDCGRVACSNCIDPIHLLCSECQAKLRPPSPPASSATSPFPLATWLFFIAFALIFIGMLLITFGSASNSGQFSGGAIILIGPIPIILGSGPYSVALIVLAGVLTIAGLMFLLVLRRLS